MAEGNVPPDTSEDQPSALSTADWQQFLHDHPDTEYLDAFIIDINGLALGKRYPVSDAAKIFETGLPICSAACLLDAMGNCNDPMGLGFSNGDPDAAGLPVPGTLVTAPWGDCKGAQVLVTLTDHETLSPVWYEPRNILKNVLGHFADLGLTPVAAVELEFFLIDPARGEGGVPLPPRSPITGGRDRGNRVFALEKLEEFSPIVTAITAAAHKQGLPTTVTSAEFAPGQFEINLKHSSNALFAADHAALLRRCVRQVARDQGLDATFMSKPFVGESGNGMHIHLSFQANDNARDGGVEAGGQNIFDLSHDTDEKLIKSVIAGMQRTMRESMAIYAANMNAFRRYEPDMFVPVTADWGYDNRSVAFRIPPGTGSARRIENRVAGADSNPYLVMAVCLAAAHFGLKNELEVEGAPHAGNAGAVVAPDLPLTPWDALDALKGASVLRRYFGDDVVDAIYAAKRGELMTLLGTPLSREYDWYL